MIIYVYKGDYRSFGFSPELWNGEVIEVEVTDDFQGGGKQYIPESGEWITDAVLPVDHMAEAESYRSYLLSNANKITADWRTDLALDIIDDVDRDKLIAWQKYIKAVKAVDITTAPEMIWPAAPGS
ncbi:Caudovirales tail fiber assembly protein [Enterobacter sp. FY-07]|uniref:tail fiber assembly protein n=1 Tax=Kosakonia oryzendophytica TaxID=1005665 RepID=UPI0007779180|nr:tail fiber assembly protein [Kosakonia oryzendophytica]AMO48901.1 Caudovirales tail fiber assembly protein [Enterobacter sp. FY-07]WBT56595.1 tail fiber assembly protein [Kosakonia oryzendophytica]